MAVVLGVGYGADAPGAALGEVEGVGMARTRCGQARLQLAVQLALATAVLGQNMGHGAGLLADLMQCLAQIGINRMGHDGGEQRHEEHRDAAGGHEHGGGLLAHGLGGDGHTGDGHDDGKRRRAVEGDGEPLAHVHGARLASTFAPETTKNSGTRKP